MSQENVETVRRFFEATRRFFDAYWRNPQSIAEAVAADDLWPEYLEALAYVHPEVEWKTAFLGETRRGHRAVARAWDDYLQLADDYRVAFQEVTDLADHG